MNKIRYEEYYADKITGEHLQVIDGVLIGREEKSCMVCYEPTRFIDICSEGHLCSKQCDDHWYTELDKLTAVQFADDNET